jgi:molybdenum cofactor cytidylyltransferase
VRLADALDMRQDDVVALVGGGGKTTAMFRLARDVADKGGRAITTTTTRIFGAQIALAPAHVMAADASPASVAAALDAHGHVLVIGATEAGSGKAEGVSLDLFGRLRAWFPGACILNEADGSRMLPFKAPAAHEPVIPAETTLVAAVVGADVFGQPLDGDHVHRPELVAGLAGAAIGCTITPEVVARVLAHPGGGRKAVPDGARFVVIVNKVDRAGALVPARETAERLLAAPGVDAVLLTAVRANEPVIERLSR